MMNVLEEIKIICMEYASNTPEGNIHGAVIEWSSDTEAEFDEEQGVWRHGHWCNDIDLQDFIHWANWVKKG